MTHRHVVLLSILCLIPGLLSAPLASAEDELDISLSAFGGWALVDDTDIGVLQPSPFIDAKAEGATLSNDLTFGGKLTGWWRIPGPLERIDFGLELDFTRFTSGMGAQTLEATGGGVATITFPMAFDIESNVLAVNLLWRYPVAVSEDLPSGRWYPYFGVGGGWSLSRMRQVGGPWQYDDSPLFQALAGAKYFITRHVALCGEYKRTQTSHDFGFQLFTLDVGLAANHFVGGVALHF